MKLTAYDDWSSDGAAYYAATVPACYQKCERGQTAKQTQCQPASGDNPDALEDAIDAWHPLSDTLGESDDMSQLKRVIAKVWDTVNLPATVAKRVAESADLPESVAKWGGRGATVLDWVVPGIPVGSLILAGVAVGKMGTDKATAAYKRMKAKAEKRRGEAKREQGSYRARRGIPGETRGQGDRDAGLDDGPAHRARRGPSRRDGGRGDVPMIDEWTAAGFAYYAGTVPVIYGPIGPGAGTGFKPAAKGKSMAGQPCGRGQSAKRTGCTPKSKSKGKKKASKKRAGKKRAGKKKPRVSDVSKYIKTDLGKGVGLDEEITLEDLPEEGRKDKKPAKKRAKKAERKKKARSKGETASPNGDADQYQETWRLANEVINARGKSAKMAGQIAERIAYDMSHEGANRVADALATRKGFKRIANRIRKMARDKAGA